MTLVHDLDIGMSSLRLTKIIDKLNTLPKVKATRHNLTSKLIINVPDNYAANSILKLGILIATMEHKTAS